MKNSPYLPLVIALFMTYVVLQVMNAQQQSLPVSFSQFQVELDKGNIEQLVIGEERLNGVFKEEVEGRKNFEAAKIDLAWAQYLKDQNLDFRAAPHSTFFSDILPLILPILIFIGFWVFILKRMGKNMGGGFVSVGKSKAKIYVETNTKTTFKDVAGADEAIEELKEIIEFLKNNEKIKVLGGKMPKGVLLVGPPGTGKTLIAKAVAGEACVPFFSTNGAEFVEMFVGVGAARVRDLFEQAKKHAPCIIFIDELDALGKARGHAMGGGNDEKEQTLNQLLVEMDGFTAQSGIIILAATNRPEILDPALLRSGRFDRQVLIDRPDKKGRQDILKIHAKKVQVDPDLEFEKIAAITVGFSGADLANLVNEAALIATRENSSMVNLDHFTRALERILTGLEKKNRLLNNKERKIVAHHEMGHALVAAALSQSENVHKVSIIPRGIGSLGYTIQRPTEERYLMSQAELEAKMSVLLAGRAAEDLIFSEVSTGASDDMVKATNIAREMVMRYGMGKDAIPISWEDSGPNYLGLKGAAHQGSYGQETASKIDANIEAIIVKAYEKAKKVLRLNKEVLLESAQELLDKEVLNEQELKKFFVQLKAV